MADTHFDGVVCNTLSSATDTDTNITFDAEGAMIFNFDGYFVILGLITEDPGVAGAVWNDAGTLKISAG